MFTRASFSTPPLGQTYRPGLPRVLWPRRASHGLSSAIARSTSRSEIAKEKRTNAFPSTGSKSIPGAVAMPVSSSNSLQSARLSSVRWLTST